MRTILIVEDDPYIRESLQELLCTEGFDVLISTDGAEALALFQAGTRPQLVLLDLMMPKMDGFAFREQQLNSPDFAHIPVVVMSADENMTANKSKLQVEAYLKKPIDIEELLSLVYQELQKKA